MPDAADNAGGGQSSYEKESTTANNAVGKTTEVTQGAPGGLNRLTVSVVMDDAVAGNLNQQQIRDLMTTAVGLDAARGDDITVASMPFDTTAADQAAAEMEAAREAEASEQMWSMIRTGGIAAGIALVVLIVWLRSRRREEAEEDYEPLELTDATCSPSSTASAWPAAVRNPPRSTRASWSSRPPNGRRCGGRSRPW
jgi:flagellar M-ring protein FliF